MIEIDLIAGARPNFMKIAPIVHEIEIYNKKNFNQIKYRIIHTGQHYDRNMSEVFFEELNIPKPHVNLKAGSGTQAEQTSQIMLGYEKLLIQNPSKICIVVGDVTSTLACSIVAKKYGLLLLHVEAGLRSYDRKMPEEINRLVTDSITDYFFTTSSSATNILINEGVNKNKIFEVGNTMIDTLIANEDRYRKPEFVENKDFSNGFILITLHRPSNVDHPKNLIKILETIASNTGDIPIIFPIHPRTNKILNTINFKSEKYIYSHPLPYLEFMYLVKNCKAIITDSGGITEEATVLGVPCLTLRSSTERPETVNIGTNVLVGDNPDNLVAYLNTLLNGNWKKGQIPELWDGKTGARIVSHLIYILKEIV
jgi:UDP-N-acetylglucosamine 2-epimerase (non-hydrolysing)